MIESKKFNDIVYFDPDMGIQYPFRTQVEELLGGIGTLIFPDGTEQFADNDSYPDVVYSPRLPLEDLEKFCKKNIKSYEEYFDKYHEKLLEDMPVPPIKRFWK